MIDAPAPILKMDLTPAVSELVWTLFAFGPASSRSLTAATQGDLETAERLGLIYSVRSTEQGLLERHEGPRWYQLSDRGLELALGNGLAARKAAAETEIANMRARAALCPTFSPSQVGLTLLTDVTTGGTLRNNGPPVRGIIPPGEARD